MLALVVPPKGSIYISASLIGVLGGFMGVSGYQNIVGSAARLAVKFLHGDAYVNWLSCHVGSEVFTCFIPHISTIGPQCLSLHTLARPLHKVTTRAAQGLWWAHSEHCSSQHHMP